MPQPLSGPGVGLPYAQYLYPSELTNTPPDFGSNRLALAPGEAIPIPAGTWYIDPGIYCVIQFQDPTNGSWSTGTSAAFAGGIQYVKSDGFTCRLANMTGCVVSAVVIAGGNGYSQSSATITPSVGNSTWAPIIGGAVSLTTIANPGANYGVPPLVFIPAPAPPSANSNGVGGIAATAYAVLSAGTVSAISFENQGAGYQIAPTATIVPNPTDPNINSGITPATITLGLTGSGQLTGAICTNSGRAFTNTEIQNGVSLTMGGTNTTLATVAMVIMQTVVGLQTVSAAGAGYSSPGLTTVGGVPSVSALVTPASIGKGWRPRPADILLSTGGGSGVLSIATIYDGGLFLGTPTPEIFGGLPTTVATVTLQMGGATDHVVIQPAP